MKEKMFAAYPDAVNVDKLREALGGIWSAARWQHSLFKMWYWQRVREQRNGVWKAHRDILRAD